MDRLRDTVQIVKHQEHKEKLLRCIDNSMKAWQAMYDSLDKIQEAVVKG